MSPPDLSFRPSDEVLREVLTRLAMQAVDKDAIIEVMGKHAFAQGTGRQLVVALQTHFAKQLRDFEQARAAMVNEDSEFD